MTTRKSARYASQLVHRNLLFGILIGIGLGLLIAVVTLPSHLGIPSSQIDLAVHGVRVDSKGSAPIVPQPGYHFVIVDVTITNRSDASIDVAPILNFYVKDRNGTVYSETAVPTQLEMHSGTLPAHDNLHEEVGFMVKDDAADLRLYYEPGVKGEPVHIVDLAAFM